MKDLTPEQQAEVQALHAALASEFTESEERKVAKTAKKDIEDLKPDMLNALERALKHGTIAQQIDVAKWGYTKLLDEGKADADPIRALIEGMPSPHGESHAAPTKEAIDGTSKDAATTEADDGDVGVTSAEAEALATDIPLDVLESSEPDPD